MPHPHRSAAGTLPWRVVAAMVVLLAGVLLPIVGLGNPLADARPASPREAYCQPGTSPRSTATTPPAQFARIIHVPGDQRTIQGAVDDADPGDLILIAPGVYHENVLVCTADLTIRGEDRNGTMLDGQGLEKRSNGFTVLADNVVIENMTAHHFDGNGFWWYGVTGYRGSYLTAYDNGIYGIYAFDSTRGEFDHSYASGSPDSGFYIGQCFPCDALITNVHSVDNGLGYSGTNAGGNLVIQHSEWDHNGAGIVPNTLDGEAMPPEHGATIIGNDVHDNGNLAAPSTQSTHPGLGAGIAVPGGDFNYIAHNHVVNNSEYGILVLGNIDKNVWLASGNVVEHNHVSGSGIADLALGSPTGANNCFSNNEAATTSPAFLEITHACGSPQALSGGGDFSVTLRLFAQYLNTGGPNYHSPDYRAIAAPPSQPNMPDAHAPPAPIFTQPFTIDHTSHGSLPAAVPPGGPAMLAPLGFTAYSIVQILLSFYGNLLLFALYAAWLAVAFVELSQRTDLTGRRRLSWGALVVGVPIVGPIVYYFAGGSKLNNRFRLALVVGAPLLCLLITGVLLVVASYTL